MDKLSYALGLNIGHQLKEMGLSDQLKVDDYASAITDVLNGNTPQIGIDEASKLLNDFFTNLEQQQRTAAKSEGERFLAENAKKPGVKVTASGLQYEVLQEGTGKAPKATDTVRCHYHGTLIDGTVFDSREGEHMPPTIEIGIEGFSEMLQLMKPGGKAIVVIPSNLAYGAIPINDAIGPNETLIFEIEIIDRQK